MPLRIVCVGGDASANALAREIIGTALPTTEIVGGGADPLRAPPAADCVVIVGAVGDEAPVDAARLMRAAGLTAAVVAVVSRPGPTVEAHARALGVRVVPDASLSTQLPAAIAEIAAAETPTSPAVLELRRTQQLIAAGELALRLQHSLNNPLTALMAEVQLLEMEPLSEDQLRSVRRMIELCRRLVGIIRGLDAVRSSGTPPP